MGVFGGDGIGENMNNRKMVSLVVTSNNLERGLIPTDKLISPNGRGIFSVDEKAVTVSFYNYDYENKEAKLFARVNECTIDERFIYVGNAGSLWFKLNFPLSYVRNVKGQNLYAGGQKGIKKTLNAYKNALTLSDDIIPYEFFIICRDCQDDKSRIEIYPQYQYTKKNYEILPNTYKEILLEYYKENYFVLDGFAKLNTNKNMWLSSDEKWISDSSKDILCQGGWYILKNSIPQEEYYFGKAENMSNRIKWQKEKEKRRIGHPQNNVNKVEPLFDEYKTWYLSFDKIIQLVDEYDEKSENLGELYCEILNIVSYIVGKIISSILGDRIILDLHDADEEIYVISHGVNEKTLDMFFDNFICMVNGANIKASEENMDNGQCHYVFNRFCSSWIKNDKLGKLPNTSGILISKDSDNRYFLCSATNLSSLEEKIEKEGYTRYICVDFKQMETDIKNRNVNNIWVGFLYGVEGLVNDILRFIFRDLNIRCLNDAFDTASNVAYNNIVDSSRKY